MWTALYYNRTTGHKYGRTVYGDTEPEANKAAIRYCNKGYCVAGLIRK